MKKVLTHLKKHWFLYGAGALFGASVLQSNGYLNFEPFFEFLGTTTDKAFKVKDIILGYAVGGYTLFKTGKAIVYPVIAEYQSTKKLISERETVVKESQNKINEELAMVTLKKNETDMLKVQELQRQNDLLENIRVGQKSLPEILSTLQVKVESTLEEFSDNTEEV